MLVVVCGMGRLAIKIAACELAKKGERKDQSGAEKRNRMKEGMKRQSTIRVWSNRRGGKLASQPGKQSQWVRPTFQIGTRVSTPIVQLGNLSFSGLNSLIKHLVVHLSECVRALLAEHECAGVCENIRQLEGLKQSSQSQLWAQLNYVDSS